jgi:hypothetical protein
MIERSCFKGVALLTSAEAPILAEICAPPSPTRTLPDTVRHATGARSVLLPPWRGKGGMGERPDSEATPTFTPPSPSPVEGEGILWSPHKMCAEHY